MASISNLSTDPKLIDKYPEGKIDLSGKGLSFKKFTADINLQVDNNLYLNGALGPYRNDNVSLISSNDFSWKLKNAKDQTVFKGVFGAEEFKLHVQKKYEKFSSIILARSPKVEKILSASIKKVAPLGLNLTLQGNYQSPNLKLNSDAPKKISNSIEQEIKNKIRNGIKEQQQAAKAKLNAEIATIEDEYRRIRKKLYQNLKLKKFNFEKNKK